jgi:TetR/AcrR family transcriptional repressor of nem operon
MGDDVPRGPSNDPRGYLFYDDDLLRGGYGHGSPDAQGRAAKSAVQRRTLNVLACPARAQWTTVAGIGTAHRGVWRRVLAPRQLTLALGKPVSDCLYDVCHDKPASWGEAIRVRCGVGFPWQENGDMRYGPEHKKRTRRKVVDLAAARLRTHGVEATGVAEIMQLAGLTHGGFYAHFKSKDSLVVAAIERMFEEVTGRIEEAMARYGPARTLDLFVDGYLCGSHRDNASRGCPIAAFAGEIKRRPRAARDAFDRGVERHIVAIARLLPLKKGKLQLDLAASILAEMTGALLLSRCATDDTASERVLERARRQVKARASE